MSNCSSSLSSSNHYKPIVAGGSSGNTKVCKSDIGMMIMAESPHLLAIDDDVHHLGALKRVLSRSGFDIATATSGRQGLRLAAHHHPDLVLVDVSMPTMSGHGFLRRFRRLEKRYWLRQQTNTAWPTVPQTPVIFLTARAEPHLCISGLNAGAVDYVTKPFDSDELRARIRCHLRRFRQQWQRHTMQKLERMKLASSIGAAQQELLTCQETLIDLDHCLVDITAAGDRIDSQQYGERNAMAQQYITRLKIALSRVNSCLMEDEGKTA